MSSRHPVLILMAGLPGSGKSTIALALGAELNLPVIDKDVIVSALLDRELPQELAHPAAYQVTFDLVEHLLGQQRGSVIVDTPAVDPSTLDWATRTCDRTGGLLVPILCLADGTIRYDRMVARAGLRSHSKGTTRRPGDGRDRYGHFPVSTIEIQTDQPFESVIRLVVEAVKRRIDPSTP